ncbi:MAG: hypothetical protein AB7Q16_12900 [Vicinamibacterales bacterium]
MRLPALLCVIGLNAVFVPSASAQASLPARSFALAEPVVAAGAVPPVVDWWRDGGPRIRPTDSRVRALLASGIERSPLLRDLVSRVESGDVIVYIGMNPLMQSGIAGCVTFVSDAGRYRYLRAMLNPELTFEQLIAALAHELHHVTEIMSHPEVRSETALASLYRRIGTENRRSIRSGWETNAAQQAGWDVRRELKEHADAIVARREARAKADQQ